MYGYKKSGAPLCFGKRDVQSTTSGTPLYCGINTLRVLCISHLPIQMYAKFWTLQKDFAISRFERLRMSCNSDTGAVRVLLFALVLLTSVRICQLKVLIYGNKKGVALSSFANRHDYRSRSGQRATLYYQRYYVFVIRYSYRFAITNVRKTFDFANIFLKYLH